MQARILTGESLSADIHAVIDSNKMGWGELSQRYRLESALPSSSTDADGNFIPHSIVVPTCPFAPEFVSKAAQEFYQGLKTSCPDLYADPGNIHVLLVNGPMVAWRAEARGESVNAGMIKAYEKWQRRAIGAVPQGAHIHNYSEIVNHPRYLEYLGRVLQKVKAGEGDAEQLARLIEQAPAEMNQAEYLEQCAKNYAETVHATIRAYLAASLAKEHPELFDEGNVCHISRDDSRYRASFRYVTSELAAMRVLEEIFAYYAYPHTHFRDALRFEHEDIQGRNPGKLAPLNVVRAPTPRTTQKRRIKSTASMEEIPLSLFHKTYKLYETALQGCNIPVAETAGVPAVTNNESVIRKRIEYLARSTTALLLYAQPNPKLYMQVVVVIMGLKQHYDHRISEPAEEIQTPSDRSVVSGLFSELSAVAETKEVMRFESNDPHLNDYLRHFCLALKVCEAQAARHRLLDTINASLLMFMANVSGVKFNLSEESPGVMIKVTGS